MELEQDLFARQEARTLARQAEAAQKQLEAMGSEGLDKICRAVAAEFEKKALELAELAVRETGFGNVEDKITKNIFASREVWQAVRDMKTLGVLNRENGDKLWKIGVPVGVVAAIVPSTNPTSTVCYKAIIALKAGCSIVFSPHPKAISCTRRAAEIVALAAEQAGAPKGAVSCLSVPSLAGCQELMQAAETRLILATGGPGMVKAAYSSGKPAIGVGAGNGPAYIHKSADVAGALKKILRSKTFDNGTVCASEQSIVVEQALVSKVKATAISMGFYFLTEEDSRTLGGILFRENGAMNPKTVGKTALELAKMAGISVPGSTKILVGSGKSHPGYGKEKLCPVLGFFVEENEAAVLQRCLEILHHEGRGHTFSIHAEDTAVVERFALCMPVSRFLVNTPAALGGIGQSTDLFPALTLGCGAIGGSATSNNVSPMDLINIRMVAWDTGKEENQPVDTLVEIITAKILEKLNKGY
ncbi:MAG: aldehyde dehydrogenase family protein [Oscillospiraceae bacterium]|nr:aldehyde dehydrogenase family protein [Oscillospiraceae bacterium]